MRDAAVSSNPASLKGVQRIVLQAGPAGTVVHVPLRFGDARSGRLLLRRLLYGVGKPPISATFGRRCDAPQDEVELAIGFTFEGLRALLVPRLYLAPMMARARAFAEGAAMRAGTHLGDTGPSAVPHWKAAFRSPDLHAIVTLHAVKDATCMEAADALAAAADGLAMPFERLVGRRLEQNPNPQSSPGAKRAPKIENDHWVHFGYRDGLSAIRVDGFPEPHSKRSLMAQEPPHARGEFLLGHANDERGNLWSFPDLPQRYREFFLDGSFGVLRDIEQDVAAFNEAVGRWVDQIAGERNGMLCGRDYVMAKLCGRWPDGRHFDPRDPDKPDSRRGRELFEPFDHGDDPHGYGCPFGSHTRRLNGREREPRRGAVHTRTRPLMRRGLPYGVSTSEKKGLLGLFFCASIEEQFEHLLGEWIDRDPLGIDIGGDGKDPLTGMHDDPDSVFVIPRTNGDPHRLAGFKSFCTTRGTAYAFYPSHLALTRIAELDFAPPEREDLWS